MTWQFGNFSAQTFNKSVMWMQIFKFPKFCSCSVNCGNCIAVFVRKIIIYITMISANIQQFLFHALEFYTTKSTTFFSRERGLRTT